MHLPVGGPQAQFLDGRLPQGLTLRVLELDLHPGGKQQRRGRIAGGDAIDFTVEHIGTGGNGAVVLTRGMLAAVSCAPFHADRSRAVGEQDGEGVEDGFLALAAR